MLAMARTKGKAIASAADADMSDRDGQSTPARPRPSGSKPVARKSTGGLPPRKTISGKRIPGAQDDGELMIPFCSIEG